MDNVENASFSDSDFEQLAAWLQRRHSGILDIVTLEGFLTAILISPNTISTMLWLPKVWGKGKPRFKDLQELNRSVPLVMGLYNEIAGCFEQDPAAFAPSFYERPLNDKTVIIVDEWCEGFIKGIRVDTEGWKPLKRERPGRCASRRRCARSMLIGCLTGARCRQYQKMRFDTDTLPCPSLKDDRIHRLKCPGESRHQMAPGDAIVGSGTEVRHP